MAAIHVTARRANRTAARAGRPPVKVEQLTADGDLVTKRRKLRRPSRHTATRNAIAASKLEGAWA